MRETALERLLAPAEARPAAPFAVRLLPLAELPARLAAAHPPLAVVVYGGPDPAGSAPVDAPPCPVVRVRAPQLNATPMAEVWESRAPVTAGAHDGLRYAHNGGALFVACEVAPQATLEADTQAAFARLLAFTRAHGYGHWLRVWAYVPGINAPEAGVERYRRFSLGRHRAFFEGEGRYTRETLPASSALGTRAGAVTLYVLASTLPGRQRENPRQVSAYDYPTAYGPRSPSFARATLARWADGAHLYVSGTASIVGHRTLHAGDVARQVDETVCNLHALLEHTAREESLAFGAEAPAALKVYVRHAADYPTVRGLLARHGWGGVPAVYLQTDICRWDLGVEIEGVWAR